MNFRKLFFLLKSTFISFQLLIELEINKNKRWYSPWSRMFLVLLIKHLFPISKKSYVNWKLLQQVWKEAFFMWLIWNDVTFDVWGFLIFIWNWFFPKDILRRFESRNKTFQNLPKSCNLRIRKQLHQTIRLNPHN